MSEEEVTTYYCVVYTDADGKLMRRILVNVKPTLSPTEKLRFFLKHVLPQGEDLDTGLHATNKEAQRLADTCGLGKIQNIPNS